MRRRPIFSCKPGYYEVVSNNFDIDHLFKTTKRLYLRHVNTVRQRVAQALKYIYDRSEFIIPDKLVSHMDGIITRMMNTCGKSVKYIPMFIRNYLGYNCAFYRWSKGQKVLVSLERIARAVQAIVDFKPMIAVENILYF